MVKPRPTIGRAARSEPGEWEAHRADESVTQSSDGAHTVVGGRTTGRRGTGRRDTCTESESLAGVRGVIGAEKRRNGRGAKDPRKVEAQ